MYRLLVHETKRSPSMEFRFSNFKEAYGKFFEMRNRRRTAELFSDENGTRVKIGEIFKTNNGWRYWIEME